MIVYQMSFNPIYPIQASLNYVSVADYQILLDLYREAQKENALLRAQLNEKNLQYDALVEDNKLKENRNTDLRNDIKLLQLENEKLKTKIKLVQKDNKKLKNNNKRLNKTIVTLQNKIKNLETQIEELKNENQNLRIKNLDLETKIQQQEITIHDFKTKFETYFTEQKDLKRRKKLILAIQDFNKIKDLEISIKEIFGKGSETFLRNFRLYRNDMTHFIDKAEPEDVKKIKYNRLRIEIGNASEETKAFFRQKLKCDFLNLVLYHIPETKNLEIPDDLQEEINAWWEEEF